VGDDASVFIATSEDFIETLIEETTTVAATTQAQEFKEELIPTGDVVEITTEMESTLTQEELEEIYFVNDYAIALADLA